MTPAQLRPVQDILLLGSIKTSTGLWTVWRHQTGHRAWLNWTPLQIPLQKRSRKPETWVYGTWYETIPPNMIHTSRLLSKMNRSNTFYHGFYRELFNKIGGTGFRDRVYRERKHQFLELLPSARLSERVETLVIDKPPDGVWASIL